MKKSQPKMLSMDCSKLKLLDLEHRIEVLDCMEVALRWYARTKDPAYLTLAQQFGATSKSIQERLTNFKYPNESYKQPVDSPYEA